MKIASFTQTYGDERILELELLKYDIIGNKFRNKCDLIIFSFHNCPDNFFQKGESILKSIYPSNKLKILRYNNITYLESIRKTIQFLKTNQYTYMLQIQDDQHGINSTYNINNKNKIDYLFDFVNEHKVDFFHIFGEEGNQSVNKLMPLQTVIKDGIHFCAYNSTHFKKANIYSWNDGTYFCNINLLEKLFSFQLPEDVWRIELTLKHILDTNVIPRWGMDQLYFKASNLHGKNTNTKLSVKENLKRFFGELSEWDDIQKMIET